jgi:hypothetical protein
MHKLHLKTEQNYVQYMEQAESNMTAVGMYVLSSNALPAMKVLC